jgi:hypothetical protein
MNKLKYIAIAGILAGAIGAWPDTAVGGVLPADADYVKIDCVVSQAMHCLKSCSSSGGMLPMANITGIGSSVTLSCKVDKACAKSAGCVGKK